MAAVVNHVSYNNLPSLEEADVSRQVFAVITLTSYMKLTIPTL
jgi:hypothetical protein